MPSICSCRKPEFIYRGGVAHRLCPTFCVAPSRPAFFRSRVPSRNIVCSSRLFGALDGWLASGIICDQTISLDGFYRPVRITPNLSAAAHPLKTTPSPARRWSSTNNVLAPAATICALYKSRWHQLFFKWIESSIRIKQFYRHVGERVEDADLDCRSVYVRRTPPSSRSASTWTPRSTLCYQILSVTLRRKCPYIKLAGDENSGQRLHA